ncbi:MAG: M28 family peptidase [Bacteroidia bacterium]|nr:M28 family peptidase [Bacteroidia bacterium]
MKTIFTLLLICITKVLLAQNNVPIVSNVTASIDTTTKQVTLMYDVSDTENDTLEVSLRISANNGSTYLVQNTNVTGAIGAGIITGTAKQIVWNYTTVSGISGSYLFKIIANDNKPVDIQAIVNSVDSMRLIADMQIIEAPRNYSTALGKLHEVRDTIYNRFANLGLETTTQDFLYGAYQAKNVIGKKQGLTQEDSVLIVDGHYDSVDYAPGADDNGSAVIGVLEAAKILSTYNFKKTIRFIGFDLEEKGLVGSKEYTNNGIKSYEKIKGVLNFEMIGFYSTRKNSQTFPTGFNFLFPAAYNQVAADTFRGNFITNVANTSSASLRIAFNTNAAMYVPDLKIVPITVSGTGTSVPDFRRSDHAPFWDKGIKALMLTDGANFRNKNYHSINDISDSLSFTFITKVVKATIATLATLAEPMHCGYQTVSITVPNIIVTTPFKSKNTQKLVIVPNPADEKLNVNWESINWTVTEIMLVDVYGKQVYKACPVESTKNNHSIFTEGFANGTYLLKIIGSNNMLTQKIIIKH